MQVIQAITTHSQNAHCYDMNFTPIVFFNVISTSLLIQCITESYTMFSFSKAIPFFTFPSLPNFELSCLSLSFFTSKAQFQHCPPCITSCEPRVCTFTSSHTMLGCPKKLLSEFIVQWYSYMLWSSFALGCVVDLSPCLVSCPGR